MTNDEERVADLLRTLQERAKELTCLYRVDELLSQLNRSDASQDDTLRAIAGVLPPGWQYPHMCRCRIVFEGSVFQPQPFEPTRWVQKATITVRGQQVGTVEVYYDHQAPHADEGPFLKEERKLIDTVADRIGSVLTGRHLKSAFQGWQDGVAVGTSPREWRAVLAFMRETDAALLLRISRKMINHLASNGVREAQALLQRFNPAGPDAEPDSEDENRPLPRGAEAAALDVETFAIAERTLSEQQILACLTKWMRRRPASRARARGRKRRSATSRCGRALRARRRGRTRPVAVAEGLWSPVPPVLPRAWSSSTSRRK
jgi:hypothetical protein